MKNPQHLFNGSHTVTVVQLDTRGPSPEAKNLVTTLSVTIPPPFTSSQATQPPKPPSHHQLLSQPTPFSGYLRSRVCPPFKRCQANAVISQSAAATSPLLSSRCRCSVCGGDSTGCEGEAHRNRTSYIVKVPRRDDSWSS